MKTTFFTGVGDKGVSNTGKKSVSKDDPVFMLLGSLDECSSWLGLAQVTSTKVEGQVDLCRWLRELQEMLFIAQAEVATISFEYGNYREEIRKFPHIKREHVARCEEIIRIIDEEFPPLNKFILQGGTEFSAQCDIARTIARKAERYAVVTQQKTELSAELLAFLNRLSSVLYAIARVTNYRLGIVENSPQY